MSYLRYLCLFAYSGVQHTMLCLFSSCLPYVASFSGLSIFIAHSVFSNSRLFIRYIYYEKKV
jgi:hypothetical protein